MKNKQQLCAVIVVMGLAFAFGSGCSAKAKKDRHLKKAEAYYQQGDYDKAEIEYLNVRRLEPTNATAIARMGIIYSRQGNIQAALPMLGLAQSLSPTNAEVQLRQALSYQALALQFENLALQYGDTEMQRESLMLRRNARETAGKVLTLNPRDGEALQVVTANAFLTNDFQDVQNRLAAFQRQNGENGWFHLATATLLSQRGDYTAAEVAVQKAVAADPKLYAAHLRLAEYALSHSNVAQAETEFKQAVELAPARSDASLRYARFKIMRGQREEARKIMQTAADQAPDYGASWRLLAQLAFEERKPEEALKFLERILLKNRMDFETLHMRAEILMYQQQPAKAASDLENVIKGVNAYAIGWQKRLNYSPSNSLAQIKPQNEAEARKAAVDRRRKEEEQRLKDEAQLRELRLTFYPQLPGAYVLASRAYEALTNQVKAVECLSQVTNLVPGFVESHVMMAQLNLRRGMDPATTVDALADFVGQLEKRNDYLNQTIGRTNAMASPVGRRFIQQYVGAVLYLADVQARMGRFSEAASIYRKLIKDNPENASLHFGLGMIYQSQTNTQLARAEYEQILKMDPGSSAALAQLTTLDIASANHAAAFARLQGALALKPKAPQLHYLMGLLLSSTTNTLDQAEASLRKCLDLDENFAPAYALLGRVYLGQRQTKESVAQLSTVLEKDPRDTRSAMLLADVHKSLKDFDKARQVYERILTNQPNFLPALNNLAYLYGEQLNHLDKAYEVGRKARSLAPDNPIIADTFGWILYRRGDYPQALTLLQESAGKMNNSPEIQYHLGMAYYMFGQVDSARGALQQAVSALADFPGKEEAQKRLSLLQGAAGQSPADAITDLERMVKDNPKDLIALIRLGQLHLQQNQAKKAGDTFEQALKVNPKAITPLTELARLYAGPLENRSKAMEYAKKARELSPANPQVLQLLGQMAFQTGDSIGAYSLLQESLRLQPQSVQTTYDFAWAAYSLGKLAEAKQAMQQVQGAQAQPILASDAKRFLTMLGYYENPQNLGAVEAQTTEILSSNPNYVPGLMVLGLLQNHRGQGKEAVQTFEKVINRFPLFSPAQRALAILYSTDPAREKQAFDLATKARLAMPQDPILAKILGKLSHDRKDFQNALRLLQETVASTPSDAEALYYLGSSYHQLKDKVRAKDALQKALAAGLKEPLAKQAQRIVGTL